MEKKDQIIYIYIGRPIPKYSSMLGNEPRIQLNDKLARISDVKTYVLEQIDKMPDDLRGLATVSLKVDKKANMGIVSDVKEELRKINVLRINYATYEGGIMP